MTVYVGTYGAGIWIFERDGARLSFLDRVDAPDPSFLVADPDPPVLYAVDELTDPSVAAFAIDEDGGLRELNRQPTGGAAPCHLLRHPAGYLLAANYDGGSVSVHPIRPDGSLGARTDLVRHTGSGPDPSTGVLHQIAAVPSTGEGSGAPASIVLSADSRRLYVSNRGPDTIATFEVDPAGDLTPIDEVSCGGSWPRHFAIDEGIMFVANERSGAVVSFALDSAGLPRPTGDTVEVPSPTCVLPL